MTDRVPDLGNLFPPMGWKFFQTWDESGHGRIVPHRRRGSKRNLGEPGQERRLICYNVLMRRNPTSMDEGWSKLILPITACVLLYLLRRNPKCPVHQKCPEHPPVPACPRHPPALKCPVCPVSPPCPSLSCPIPAPCPTPPAFPSPPPCPACPVAAPAAPEPAPTPSALTFGVLNRALDLG